MNSYKILFRLSAYFNGIPIGLLRKCGENGSAKFFGGAGVFEFRLGFGFVWKCGFTSGLLEFLNYQLMVFFLTCTTFEKCEAYSIYLIFFFIKPHPLNSNIVLIPFHAELLILLPVLLVILSVSWKIYIYMDNVKAIEKSLPIHPISWFQRKYLTLFINTF